MVVALFPDAPVRRALVSLVSLVSVCFIWFPRSGPWRAATDRFTLRRPPLAEAGSDLRPKAGGCLRCPYAPHLPLPRARLRRLQGLYGGAGQAVPALHRLENVFNSFSKKTAKRPFFADHHGDGRVRAMPYHRLTRSSCRLGIDAMYRLQR